MSQSVHGFVCEREGDWAAALRWHSKGSPLPLRETRGLLAARAALLESPSSLLALETTAANAEGVLRLILEARSNCPASRTIVLLTSECSELAPIFWEIGALFVARSPRRMDRVVRLIRRHLLRQETEATESSFRERVWEQLPWA
jgi:hypothetical protein